MPINCCVSAARLPRLHAGSWRHLGGIAVAAAAAAASAAELVFVAVSIPSQRPAELLIVSNTSRRRSAGIRLGAPSARVAAPSSRHRLVSDLRFRILWPVSIDAGRRSEAKRSHFFNPGLDPPLEISVGHRSPFPTRTVFVGRRADCGDGCFGSGRAAMAGVRLGLNLRIRRLSSVFHHIREDLCHVRTQFSLCPWRQWNLLQLDRARVFGVRVRVRLIIVCIGVAEDATTTVKGQTADIGDVLKGLVDPTIDAHSSTPDSVILRAAKAGARLGLDDRVGQLRAQPGPAPVRRARLVQRWHGARTWRLTTGLVCCCAMKMRKETLHRRRRQQCNNKNMDAIQ